MSAPAKRRRLLGCLLTLPAFGSLGVAAVGDGADPILDLARRTAEAEAAWSAADAALDEISDQVCLRQPPPPETLFQTVRDQRVLWMVSSSTYVDGRLWYGEPAAIEELRLERGPSLDPDLPTTEVRRRADEILAAHDGWIPRCNEIADELGLGAADARSTECRDAYKALLGELAQTPATSQAGILAKARLGAQLFGTEEPFGDPGSHDVDRVAFSIVRDVLALEGAIEARRRGGQS